LWLISTKMKQFSDLVKKMPSRTNTPSKNDDQTAPITDDCLEDNYTNTLGNEFGKEGGILTAVRVRPLNTREIGGNNRIVVSSTGYMSQGLRLLNPVFFKSSMQTEKLRKLEEREFSFDYTFWSTEGGHSTDVDFDTEYSFQVDIYNKIGKPIIENALAGFNSSLFAYGQTGSGKTYTMMGHNASIATTSIENLVDSDDDSDLPRGDGDDSGLIPRLCKDLLGAVKDLCTKPGDIPETFCDGEQVIEAYMRAAYYEIYNEKLYDLLAEDYELPRKVREHAIEGAYVEGLTYQLIQTYEDIESVLRTGQEKRQTAETKMNAESSRSHAIFVIQLTQKLDIRSPIHQESGGNVLTSPINMIIGKNKPPTFTSHTVERKSKICLIDLAGSERLSTTGATGDRLKEATNINSSLSTLGDVIRKLSDQGISNSKMMNGSISNGANGANGVGDDANVESAVTRRSSVSNVHIPYRNSILTWILKDSLGGNSKTAIVATISPSESSYAESLNTLRYLERAKYIEVNAVINDHNSQDPYIKHLQHQLSSYKSKLNSAVSKLRQQESDHKATVAGLTDEVERWKSRVRSPHPDDTSREIVSKSSSIDERSEWPSGKNLSYDMGSDVDLMDLVRGISLDDGSCDGSEIGHARRRFERSPSKRSIHETRGRTKEYFENECYDLQDALARSMAECNNLRTRLSEVEDLNNIEIDILNEELMTLSNSRSQASEDGDGVVVESSDAITTQHKESIANLQVTVERLQMRLHNKDLDLIAAKTQAQEEVEGHNQVIYNLEIEKAEYEKLARTAADVHDQLLSDYNELAIDFAKINAEKDSEIKQLETTIHDLRNEVEVFNSVIASKDEIIAVSKASLSAKEDEAMKDEGTHEDELNSVREVINMCKAELADREERLESMTLLLKEKEATIEAMSNAKLNESSGTGSSLLDALEEAAVQHAKEDGGGEMNDGKKETDTEALLAAYKDQVRALEAALLSIQGKQNEEVRQQNEIEALMAEDFEGRIARLQEAIQTERQQRDSNDRDLLDQKSEMLSKLVQIAEQAKQEADDQLAEHEEVVKKYEEAAIDYESQISDLKGLLLDSEAYVEKLVGDWKEKEAAWDETEESHEKIVHTLTDEIEVLEVDLSAKNSCLELFESQLVAQETELKNVQAKHDETVGAMKVDADVMNIYLTAKEENVEILEARLMEKEKDLNQLREEKKLIEDGLTIELESFKLALADKEESHKDLMKKLEEAVKNTGMSEEDKEDINALIMESEILKQEVTVKEQALMERQESLTELFEVSEALSDTLAGKDEQLRRLTTVDIPRLQRELVAKEADFADTLRQKEEDKGMLEGEIDKLKDEITSLKSDIDALKAEIEAMKALDTTVPGKKSKFICF